MKLFVLISVLDDVANGRYQLTATLPCSGAVRTVDTCIQKMVNVSDNCATYSLVRQTGFVKFNSMLHGVLNMSTASTLHHWCPSSCPDYESPCPEDDGTDLDNSLATHDILHAFQLIHSNTILPAKYTQLAYRYLEHAGGWPQMLRRFVPVPIAHKQGWLPATEGFNPLTENDVGIGFACADYGAAVLTRRKWTDKSEDDVALALGAEIGRLAYCTFQTDGVCTDGVRCSDVWAQPPHKGCA